MFEVYKSHRFGFTKQLVGTYNTQEEAQKEKSKIQGSVYDAWVTEAPAVNKAS